MIIKHDMLSPDEVSALAILQTGVETHENDGPAGFLEKDG
jgi:hypothetical protein